MGVALAELQEATGKTSNIVPCEPGTGAAEDNSRLSTHERKLD